MLAVRRVELHVIRLVRSTEAQGFSSLRFCFWRGFRVPKSERLIPSARPNASATFPDG
jgi:hypothetical protein